MEEDSRRPQQVQWQHICKAMVFSMQENQNLNMSFKPINSIPEMLLITF